MEDNNATETDVIKQKTCNSSTPKQKSRVLYPPAKYCIDQMVVDYRLVNKTVPPSMDGIVLEFATICVHHKVKCGHIIPILNPIRGTSNVTKLLNAVSIILGRPRRKISVSRIPLGVNIVSYSHISSLFCFAPASRSHRKIHTRNMWMQCCSIFANTY